MVDRQGLGYDPDKKKKDNPKEHDPLYELKIFGIGIIVGGFLRQLFVWLQT
jgi:hypothetical protein